jgi:SWI/SNF-related matrix-associated actin-dependent regulator 1 of chromatin subfamily A
VVEAVVVNYDILPEAHKPECLARRKSKVKVPGEHKKDCLKAQRNVFIPAVAQMAKRCKGCLLESDLAKRCKGCAPFLDTVPENLTVVADEAHALKNPNAQRTVRFRGISRRVRASHGRVWVLTGTPLLNKPPELWSVLDAAEVAESAFGSFKGMVEMFGGKSKHFGGFDWGQPDQVKIATGMQAVMLRRLREEVMPELPRKTVQLWPVEISGALSKACDAAVEKYGGMEAIQADLKKGVSFGTLARVRAALATAKMDAMLQMVEEYEEEGEPVVVFSAHRAPIDVLAHRPGWAVITGDTTPEERTEIEDQFQAGKLRGVGSTIKAGGVAITLTRACFALFVDLEWTPGLNQQAEDRIVRIGQKRAVLIRILVAEHKLDERVAELLEEKTDIIDASVNAARERVG